LIADSAALALLKFPRNLEMNPRVLSAVPQALCFLKATSIITLKRTVKAVVSSLETPIQ
jgi:hypothetical protein